MRSRNRWEKDGGKRGSHPSTRSRGVDAAWLSGHIAVLVDPKWETVRSIRPDVLVDAIIAKRNLGTRIDDAPVVIGLGPGFTAGKDVHFVVETNRDIISER